MSIDDTTSSLLFLRTVKIQHKQMTENYKEIVQNNERKTTELATCVPNVLLR